jgi:uncharacterized protein (TIGR02466 family)
VKVDIQKKIIPLFPTILYKGSLVGSDDINKKIKAAIRKEKKMDSVGINRSNQLGSWHSKNNLYKKEVFIELAKVIESFADSISEEWHYSKGKRLGLAQMWAMINPPGAFNMAHTHPGSLWSGVYYVQVPENSGAIVFEDPRSVAVAVRGSYENTSNRPECAWVKITFQPEVGDFFIFPSWLRHSVEPNFSMEKGNKSHRMIVSFNLDQFNVDKE